ncbi:transcription termination factor MTEF18, mitochondrial isoform X2 [Magnolia sinica]|uniref:transcription termination factor MTEF18, mitochondrial isoform X2 n=1 Tax=Magnolia sinica TaxID=86752 RepID=UPI0026590848|nr:transcription termination factor MTEF18, mitochondrial isoform X2 [Magnolia sinica]XP_058104360.1 transcription termination factor MTEF18, mitochondrial isoform X2 [Magnolia sinica]
MHSPPLSNHISRLFYHSLRRISTVRRPQALIEAQEALTDYLHSTRSLPFTHAEHISTNSPSSLSALLSKIKFPSSNVSHVLHRFLRYHPINEFEFFFESIGLSPPEIPAFLPAHQFFLSDASNLVSVVRALVEYGFPWNKLGRIYKEEVSIFGEDLGRLKERLRELEALGFNRVSVVGICLAFPSVLDGNGSLGGGVDALLDDLKRVFFDFDLVGSVGGNLDACYEVCRKIRVFYDLGCEKGKTGELIGTNRDILFEFVEEVLVEKVEFFCRLGARKEDVGLFILRCPEILKFELEGRVITIFDYLEQLGLDHKELTSIVCQYPHVLGKNRLRNLPQSMRALDLHSWFADKIMNGNHHLLPGFVTGNYEEELEKDFRNDIERINHPTKHHHMSGKLDFLLQIGFGNNRHSIEILRHMHGTGIQLQERFNCLLQMGIEHSKLCKMISMSPKILNQNTDMLKQKLGFTLMAFYPFIPGFLQMIFR